MSTYMSIEKPTKNNYVPIEIPTKKYVKAFVFTQLGDHPRMSTDSVIGNKLFDVLQRSTNERRTEFPNKRYNCKMRVYVSLHTFRKQGANLNETNVQKFNLFCELLLKDKMRFLLDTFVALNNSFEKSLDQVREIMKIDDDDWETESIRKDYYRYRLRQKLPLLYEKS